MTLDTPLFVLGDLAISPMLAVLALLAAITLALVALLVGVLRAGRQRAEQAEAVRIERESTERHLADLMRVQSEMTGRMQTMAEIFGTRTSDLARLMTERLESSSQRMGQAMAETRSKTEESLGKLNERLAVIDRAQSTIAQLSGEIVSLQSILANKQQRGAFGQGRMEAIICDGLAENAYRFQPTLSNGKRPDCLIVMPNKAPALVIDAKFPLESWQRLTDAATPEEARLAGAGFKSDMGVHIKAIAENYLIPGETQDTAFLFVPSESIFADIHEKFDDVVQRASRARVVIVSPSLLMLSIQVVQALLRDVRMREQAHLIQKEVRELLADLGRLDERVRKLQTHFQQASTDISDIAISSGKITRRGERIEAMDFAERPELLAGG